jgi:NitT/TauT family transport system ATP-binding protein
MFNRYAPVIQGLALYQGITTELSPGSVMAVMGPSGCGKTSLFRAIKKEIPSVGSVTVDNSELFTVFQNNDQLFDWYTVEKNLDLVCTADWQHLTDRWNLTDLKHRYPHQLSVGQRQRITLIRAICSGRSLLLCDEPLSAVDGITAIQIAKDFQEIVHEKQLTALWITHNALEASYVADQVLMISADQVTVMSEFTHESILKSF